MDPDDNRLDMLRESIRLTEEILNGLVRSGTEQSQTEAESGVVARLTHGRDWRLRYLNQLGHDLAIEWGYEAWDENRIGLRCRSCDDWIQLYDVDTGPTADPTISGLYVEHETHTVLSWRRGAEAGIECVTCGAVEDDGFPLLATSVSDWFDEVWNG